MPRLSASDARRLLDLGAGVEPREEKCSICGHGINRRDISLRVATAFISIEYEDGTPIAAGHTLCLMAALRSAAQTLTPTDSDLCNAQ